MSTATNIQALVSALPSDVMKQLNIQDATVVSHRTIKISLKNPAPDGTNQIKVTVEGGKFMVRGYRVEETEVAYGMTGDAVGKAVLDMATGATGNAESILASVLKNAAGK